MQKLDEMSNSWDAYHAANEVHLVMIDICIFKATNRHLLSHLATARDWPLFSHSRPTLTLLDLSVV